MRVAAGGPVEGLGHRGPPVHHQRLVVGAVDGQAADVEASRCRVRVGPRFAVVALVEPVDPTEGQGLVADVELLEPGHGSSGR